MKLSPSNDYHAAIALAKSAMANYFLRNDIPWDDDERLAIYRACELYWVCLPERAGYCLLREKEGRFFLADIQVLPLCRNNGVGGRVIDEVKRVARSRGYSQVWLKVFKGSPAINLYQRKGFMMSSEEKFVYVLVCDLKK